MQAPSAKPCVLCSLLLVQLTNLDCSLHRTREQLRSDLAGLPRVQPEQRSRAEQIEWALRHFDTPVPAAQASYRRIVEQLRADGPAALADLLAAYRSNSPRDGAHDEGWRSLIDQVAQQRDAMYGGIFWYRDLARAKRVAKATGRPILSLRMLGALTDEFSCANSRLFRTLLYADPALASWLNSEFVMHWSSERPVPKVEIDFGDGRTLRRTLTGNSAHYVLDTTGDVLDIVPGLWSPAAFREVLTASLQLHGQMAAVGGRRVKRQILQVHHGRLERAAETKLTRARQQLGRSPQAFKTPPKEEDAVARVPAIEAVPMAMSKAMIEAPVLQADPRMIGGRGSGRDGSPGAWTGLREQDYHRLGQTMFEPYRLAAASIEIMQREQALNHISGASRRARAAGRMEAALQASVMADTAKNAFELRPRVHAELSRRLRLGQEVDFETLNTWVYTSLFQTPAGDPWLGLVDDTVYTGLVGGGIARGQ